MKHMTLDCYGANERPLDDVKFINEILNKLVYKLKIKPIEPPHLLPYYYGSVKEDIGVSGKMLLLGGHVTIHTFPLRTCYFVDIFYDGEFDEQEVIDFFNYELPYNQNTSNIEVRNRDINSFNMVPYNKDCDFGPHIHREGFHDWNKTAARETIFYGEYECVEDVSKRAPYVKQLSADMLASYTKIRNLRNFYHIIFLRQTFHKIAKIFFYSCIFISCISQITFRLHCFHINYKAEPLICYRL